MSVYRMTVESDYRLIKGEEIPRQKRADIAAALLRGARPDAVCPDGRRALYPIFYVPEEPVKSLLNQTPKTKILAGNMYELEILRMLCLLAPENEAVARMRDETLRRLRRTCFGNEDDGVGECFDASLLVLRFLCAAAPGETEWMQSRIDNYNRHAGEKKRPWFPLWYFWLCLSEMPLKLALPEIEKHRPELVKKLNRSYVMHSEHDRTVHPVVLCMLRNLMSRLPEYAHIKGRQPYVSGKDGRLYLDLEKDADAV